MTTIPSQLPPIVTAARSGTLQALALQSGQVLDARIIGAASNGATQVEIRGQLLNLILPVPVKAGQTIQLAVQGSGAQLKLALQGAVMPGSAPAPAPAAPAAAAPAPAQPLPQQPASLALPNPSLPPNPSVSSTPTPPVTPQTAPTAQAAPQPPPLQGSPALAMSSAPATAPPAASSPAQIAAPATPLPAAAPIPYPQAAPAVQTNPAAAATAQTGQAPAAAMAAPTLAGGTKPVSPASPVASATANPLPQTPQSPPSPTTPQAALAQMVHAAVPRQGSVVALTTALQSVAGKVALPEPVMRAAKQVMAARVVIDAPRFDGASLQAAIKASGVFQESSLGQSTLPQPDMKTALLGLRQTLVNWLGAQAAMPAVTQVAPPLKGMVPRARVDDAPPLDVDAAPEEVGKHLLERTESALARTRLHQHASLPDLAARTADWSLDLPVLIGQHQTLMQFQIHRDEHAESEAPGERGWQMRFAINLPNMGEVGAQVSLRAGSTGVMLWASDPAASAALAAEADLLREALAAAGLKLGSVIIRQGEPQPQAPAPSGHFVDSRS